jgi:UDP-N-acetylmuramoyl-tripeptide--D-alanyl-D-alanine ligase
MLVVIGTVACALALVPAAARWLRVAQREHYLPGSTTRFAWRWWSRPPAVAVLALVAVAGAGVAFAYPIVAVVTAVVVIVGPPLLGVRGRTSPLAFTRRLRLLAVVWLVLQAAVIVIGTLVHRDAPVAALGACAVPLLVDVACALLSPLERRLVAPYITTARARLAQVAPTVVAITGSFGKTSTKQHVAHLVAGSRTVVASPASFNNRAGLARAVNEQLTPGTDIFVAEMGTYGKGEIADLCRWCPPSIAVITAIGPVHLERFKTEDAIVVAKSEIVATAHTVVLNVDDPRLAALGQELASAGGKKVVRCSAIDVSADVCVVADGAGLASASVFVAGVAIGTGLALPASVQPTNLACALAVAFALGVPHEVALARLAGLPSVPNRLASGEAPSGVWVIDDTFNSNPSGARAALAVLAGRGGGVAGGGAGGGGRQVVVTPGMVELGPRQFEENRAFAAAASEVATDLVIVGSTNRRALRAGWAPRPLQAVRTREEAVAWVRATLGPGDAVLYENDLPDHYR